MSDGRSGKRVVCSLLPAFLSCAAIGQAAQIWTANGDLTSILFGWSVSRAGDVNGDGHEELIIGAPHGKKTLYHEGKIFVYYGGVGGLDAADHWTDVGGQSEAELGRSVTGGGDLNGDGYDDVAAGAQYFTNGQTDEGAVFIYHGSADGLPGFPQVVLECDQANAMFGSSVAIPGDVNGDGFDDLLVGAPYYNDGPVNEGTAFLYFGSPSGVGNVANWTFDTQQASSYARVYGVGDVNGDGFADFAVTSMLYDAGETDEGRVFLFHGSPTGPAASPDWAFSPDDDYSYTNLAASAGDINADGYGDVIIGAYSYGWLEESLTGDGAAFLFHGSAAGLGAQPVWMMQPGGQGSQFGYTACGVGDADGDGSDDVLVCDRECWAATPQEGRATLYGGTLTGLATPPLWDQAGGQGSAFFGHAACGGMDTNGDARKEWLVSAPYHNAGQGVFGSVFLFQWSDLSTGLVDVVDDGALIVRDDAGIPVLEMRDVLAPSELLLTDARGRVVLRKMWNGTPLRIAGTAQGLYVVRVLSGAQQWVRKIMVQ